MCVTCLNHVRLSVFSSVFTFQSTNVFSCHWIIPSTASFLILSQAEVSLISFISAVRVHCSSSFPRHQHSQLCSRTGITAVSYSFISSNSDTVFDSRSVSDSAAVYEKAPTSLFLSLRRRWWVELLVDDWHVGGSSLTSAVQMECDKVPHDPRLNEEYTGQTVHTAINTSSTNKYMSDSFQSTAS